MIQINFIHKIGDVSSHNAQNNNGIEEFCFIYFESFQVSYLTIKQILHVDGLRIEIL